MLPHPVYAGIDVSKDHLDVFIPGQGHLRFGNTPAQIRKLLRKIGPIPGLILCCEASGGYEQELVQASLAKGIDMALVLASRVRHWARSQGILAKTDRIDAVVISRYAASTPGLRLVQPPCENLVRLKALVRRRKFEVDRLTALRNHLRLEREPDLKRMGRSEIRAAEKTIARLLVMINELIDSDDQLKSLAQRLEKPKGIGRMTSATVIAEMSLLGQVGAQAAAAYAGLAPYNYDSGPYRGRRRICGGNAHLRSALYMAAISAANFNPILRDFYQRLLANGKDKKLALIAVARKLARLIERIAADAAFDPA
ncbi:MAG: IS110 family transposase [Anaerolineae bacterium]|nr:IS110 family transposase [Anaerolineae bacterium]